MRTLGKLENLTVDHGPIFPTPNEGELFILKNHASLPNGIYHYENGAWLLVGSTAVREFATTGILNGSEVTSYVNASRSLDSMNPIVSATTLPATTTPANTDGTEIWTANYQLAATGNHLYVAFDCQISLSGPKNRQFGFAVVVFKDGTPFGGVVRYGYKVPITEAFSLSSMIHLTPGDTSQHTYSLRAGLLDNLSTDGLTWSLAGVDGMNWGTLLSNSSFVSLEETA